MSARGEAVSVRKLGDCMVVQPMQEVSCVIVWAGVWWNVTMCILMLLITRLSCSVEFWWSVKLSQRMGILQE